MDMEARSLASLWRRRKGLLIPLLAGAVIVVLAAVAPQAWATPDQERLSETITDFNDNPTPPECIRDCDGPMEVSTTKQTFKDPTGAWFTGEIDVYVTENTEWITDTTEITDVVVYHETVVQVTEGEIDPAVTIWPNPIEGFYDVFFDVDRDGKFEDLDGIMGPKAPEPDDEAVGAGICVVPCPVGGATVGDRPPASLVPVAGVAVLIGVGTAVALLRRRRHA